MVRQHPERTRPWPQLASAVWLAWFIPCVAGCTAQPDVVAYGLDADAGQRPQQRDAGTDPCDLDGLLEQAGIPREGLIVAATCQLPVSWLTEGAPVDVGEQDLVALLMSSGPIETDGSTPAELLCRSEFGFWFFDNPFDPELILLCPELCEFIRGEVAARIEDLGCPSGLPTTDASVPGGWPGSLQPRFPGGSRDEDGGLEQP